jgi:hypothetical protein
MFYTFMHLKIKSPFAETIAKMKTDEAKQGAFNQIINNPLLRSILRNIYFRFLRTAVPILLCLVLKTGITRTNDYNYTEIY